MTNEKILVVDDERTVCNSINKILSRKGYSVDKSLNAEEAMIKINNNKYDLVITDMRMPKVSGIELLELIKKYYPELEVVMITGYPSVDTAVEAMKLGASDYLSKPFTPNELIEIAENALEKRKLKPEESKKVEDKDEEITVYSSGLIEEEKKDISDDIRETPSDLLDVDMPFNKSELEKYTSKAYVNSLTRSDILISSKYKDFDSAYIRTDTKKQKKNKKSMKEIDFNNVPEKNQSKGIVDTYLPYKYSELVRMTGPDYINALDRTDIPRAALYAREFAKKHLVLVVDDPMVHRILGSILPKDEFAVDTVSDEAAAMNKMKYNEYDLIFLNVNQSKSSHTEVLNKIKSLYPDVPVIIVSGKDSVNRAVDVMKTGAFHYINKPFTIDEFKNVTKEALSM